MLFRSSASDSSQRNQCINLRYISYMRTKHESGTRGTSQEKEGHESGKRKGTSQEKEKARVRKKKKHESGKRKARVRKKKGTS